jgi:hypothetical protein
MCMSRGAMGAPSSGSRPSDCMPVADSPDMSYLTFSGWWLSIGNTFVRAWHAYFKG